MRRNVSLIFLNLKTIYLLLLVAVLVPTYFIHSEKYPDWGDDFAQYIYQSQQINSPSKDYKQVLNIEEYSSPKRSLAFSILLSVIPPTFSIQHYVNLISVCYILAGFCFFLFLTRYFSMVVSLMGTLCVFYNFLFLRLKSEVVPEFLFIAFFYGILYLTTSSKKWVTYLIPVLLGVLVSVRFVGLSLVVSYILFLFFNQKNKTGKEVFKNGLMGAIIFTLVIKLVTQPFLTSYFFIIVSYWSFSTALPVYKSLVPFFVIPFKSEIPFNSEIKQSVAGVSFTSTSFSPFFSEFFPPQEIKTTHNANNNK